MWYFPSGYAPITRCSIPRYQRLSVTLRNDGDHKAGHSHHVHTGGVGTTAARPPQGSPQNPRPSIPHALLTPKSPAQTPAKGSFSPLTKRSHSSGAAAPAKPDDRPSRRSGCSAGIATARGCTRGAGMPAVRGWRP